MWIDNLIREQNVSDDRASAASSPRSADEDTESEHEPEEGDARPHRPMTIYDRTLESEEEEPERQGPYNDAITSDGSLRDMFIGMVLGFLLSFTILFFWVPSSLLLLLLA